MINKHTRVVVRIVATSYLAALHKDGYCWFSLYFAGKIRTHAVCIRVNAHRLYRGSKIGLTWRERCDKLSTLSAEKFENRKSDRSLDTPNGYTICYALRYSFRK